MSVSTINQPLSLKSLLRTVLALAMGVGLYFAGQLAWQELVASNWYQRQQVFRYLTRESGCRDFSGSYNFNLKQNLADLKTNLVLLTQAAALTDTNLVGERQTNAMLRQMAITLQADARQFKSRFVALEAEILEKERRLTNRLAEVAVAETNVWLRASNVNFLSLEAVRWQTAAVKLTNEVSAVQSSLAIGQSNLAILKVPPPTNALSPALDLAAVQQSVASNKIALAGRQDDLLSARRQVSQLRQQMAEKEISLTSHRQALATARTNVLMLQTNVAALCWEARTQRQAWLAKGREMAANEAAMAASAKRIETLTAQRDQHRKELAAKQREITRMEYELANQYAVWSRELQKKLTDVSSYGVIYGVIGQQLQVAETLLKSAEPQQQRTGVMICLDAVRLALDQAENFWLASRLSQVYLWPHLRLADPPDKPRNYADLMLAQAGRAFNQADETNNLIRNLRLQIEFAVSENRANSARYYLASTFEQLGRYEDAIQWVKQITDTTNYAGAVRRLPYLEDKAKMIKAGKKK